MKKTIAILTAITIALLALQPTAAADSCYYIDDCYDTGGGVYACNFECSVDDMPSYGFFENHQAYLSALAAFEAEVMYPGESVVFSTTSCTFTFGNGGWTRVSCKTTYAAGEKRKGNRWVAAETCSVVTDSAGDDHNEGCSTTYY